MGKRPDLSAHQKKIVGRYYAHRDTIMATKIAEIVSELYLCTDAKKAGRLWTSAATALASTGADAERARRTVEKRDLQELAKIAGEMAVQ